MMGKHQSLLPKLTFSAVWRLAQFSLSLQSATGLCTHITATPEDTLGQICAVYACKVLTDRLAEQASNITKINFHSFN
jgi:hypothetical protein